MKACPGCGTSLIGEPPHWCPNCEKAFFHFVKFVKMMRIEGGAAMTDCIDCNRELISGEIFWVFGKTGRLADAYMCDKCKGAMAVRKLK